MDFQTRQSCGRKDSIFNKRGYLEIQGEYNRRKKINLWLYIIWVSVTHHHIHTHEYTTNTHLPKHALKFYIEYFDLKDKNTIVTTTNNTWLHIENACL